MAIMIETVLASVFCFRDGSFSFDMVFQLWNKWGMNTKHPMTYRLTWSAGQQDFTDFSEAHAALIALIDGVHPEAELVRVDG
jgi:hypothetical protein